MTKTREEKKLFKCRFEGCNRVFSRTQARGVHEKYGCKHNPNKVDHPLKGKTKSDAHKKTLSKANKNNPNIIEAQKLKWQNKEYRKNLINSISDAQTKLWQNKDYRKNQVKAISRGNIERFKGPKEHEKASIRQIERFKDPNEHIKQSKNTRNPDTLTWNDWTYRMIHNFIKRIKPKPKYCEVCGKRIKKSKKLHCSYNYFHRNFEPWFYSLNPTHYRWRCSHCHQKYDKTDAFWSRWSEEQVEEYTKNLKILKTKWPHLIERKIHKIKKKGK